MPTDRVELKGRPALFTNSQFCACGYLNSEQVDFCYLNSKSSRKKLVRTLFNVPRSSLELIPYYSRMIATLSTCMKDVAPMILQLLEEEFNFLMNKKV